MPNPTFTRRSFDLLDELHANNTKEWFDAHRADVRADLQEPFAHVLLTVSAALRKNFPPLSGDQKTMFRLNRDVRFSADKLPYKENISGLLTPSGRKNEDAGLVYLHLARDGGFVAAGFHQLPTPRLNKIREQLIDGEATFANVLKTLENANLSFSTEDSLKRMPRGFEDCADAKFADIVRLKTLVVQRPLTKKTWINGNVADEVTSFAKIVSPLLRFGIQALG